MRSYFVDDADEYDAAQEQGDVQSPGGNRVSNVPERNNAPTVEDLGLTRKQIHEARKIRDAGRSRARRMLCQILAGLPFSDKPHWMRRL